VVVCQLRGTLDRIHAGAVSFEKVWLLILAWGIGIWSEKFRYVGKIPSVLRTAYLDMALILANASVDLVHLGKKF
jgi:hypothetical protein